MPGQDVLVIGLGYVGLPLAIAAARSGFRVSGLDTSEKIVAGLMAGRSHVDDVTDAEIAEMLGVSRQAVHKKHARRSGGEPAVRRLLPHKGSRDV